MYITFKYMEIYNIYCIRKRKDTTVASFTAIRPRISLALFKEFSCSLILSKWK